MEDVIWGERDKNLRWVPADYWGPKKSELPSAEDVPSRGSLLREIYGSKYTSESKQLDDPQFFLVKIFSESKLLDDPQFPRALPLSIVKLEGRDVEPSREKIQGFLNLKNVMPDTPSVGEILGNWGKPKKRASKLALDVNLFNFFGKKGPLHRYGVVDVKGDFPPVSYKKKPQNFVVSEVIARYVEAGIEVVYRGNIREEPFLSESARQDILARSGDAEFLRELRNHIGLRVTRIISTLGQHARGIGETGDKILYRDGRWEHDVAKELVSYIPVDLNDMTVFLHTLAAELAQFVDRGGEISGSWGQLRHSNNRIYLSLSEWVPDSGVTGETTLAIRREPPDLG